MRDNVLRVLTRKTFLYIAFCWLCCVVTGIVGVAICYIGLFKIVPEGSIAPEAKLELWVNRCFQWLTAFFSYLNLIAMPWRLSVAHHMWVSHRSCEPGKDFYGRETEAIWFHLPRGRRKVIAFCLITGALAHYVQQIGRIIWHTYDMAEEMPGTLPINLGFVLSIVFPIIGGVAQGVGEGRLQKAEPSRFPPGIGKDIQAAMAKVRRGELRVCSCGEKSLIGAIFREMRQQKEKANSWHIAKEIEVLQRRSRNGDGSARQPPDSSAAGVVTWWQHLTRSGAKTTSRAASVWRVASAPGPSPAPAESETDKDEKWGSPPGALSPGRLGSKPGERLSVQRLEEGGMAAAAPAAAALAPSPACPAEAQAPLPELPDDGGVAAEKQPAADE